MSDEDSDAELSPLGTLVAECMAELDRGGPDALAACCERHPELADALRRRVARLADLGLVDSGRFGPYRILRTLGVGGMGVVSLVRDERLERSVALKAIPTHLARRPRALERFRREMRAVARLSHERIVPILDHGEVDGIPYFTMEYVDGPTLAVVLERLRVAERSPERLTVDDLRRALVDEAVRGAEAEAEAERETASVDLGRSHVEGCVRLVLDVADALEHAHAQGVVHRDVKPGNILVRRDGRALLLDFGLAHLSDQEGPTRTGDLTGTPAYMAPEQTSGDDAIDARADVYSLGVVLYELLTLHRPHERGGARASATSGLDDAPIALRRHNARVPHDLAIVCHRAIERRPEHRYPSARALADDLRRVLAFEPIEARPPSTLTVAARFVRRRPATTLALLLMIVVAVGLPIGLDASRRAIEEQRDLAQRSLAVAEEQRQLARDAAERADAEAARARAEADRSRSLLAGADELNGMILDMLTAPARTGRGLEVRLRDVLEDASLHAGDTGNGQLEVALRNAIATTYLQLGEFALARVELERAIALADDPEVHVDPSEQTVALGNLGNVAIAEGDLATGIELLERAVSLGRSDSLEHSRRHATTLSNLATAYATRGDLERGVSLLEEALALHRALGDPEHPSQIEAEINLANSYDDLDRQAEALALAEEVLPRARASLGPGHRSTLIHSGNLAVMRSAAGDDEGAASLLREAIAAGEGPLGHDHPKLGSLRSQLAGVLRNLGQWSEAKSVVLDAFAGLRVLEPQGGEQTLMALDTLCTAMAYLGETNEAAEVALAAAEIVDRRSGISWHARWRVAHDVAMTLELRGEIDQAKERLEAFRESARAGGADDEVLDFVQGDLDALGTPD